MKIKSVKYGKRGVGEDGNSEQLEVFVEVGPDDDAGEAFEYARRFVRDRIRTQKLIRPVKPDAGPSTVLPST